MNQSSHDRARPSHETDLRRRRGTWVASCSCGWSQGTTSGFVAWSAARTHLRLASAAPGTRRRDLPSTRSAVRLLEPEPSFGDGRENPRG